jgi:hypothetical protein
LYGICAELTAPVATGSVYGVVIPAKAMTQAVTGVKLQGSRIDDTAGDSSGVELRLPLMHTLMVTQRG